MSLSMDPSKNPSINSKQNMNKNLLIYQMQSQQQEEKYDNQDLRITSKSDGTKYHQAETQISESRPAEKYVQTEIIRVSPQSKTNNPQEHHHEIINFQEQENLDDTQNQAHLSELGSPVKLKKPRRTQATSNPKRITNISKSIIFQDIQSLQASQQFDYSQQSKSQKLQRASEIQFDDSERIFDIKKQINHEIQRGKITKQQGRWQNSHKIMSELQAEDSEQFEQKEDFYQHQIYSEEEEMILSSEGLSNVQQKHPIKILSQMQTQILVEANIQSLIRRIIPKGLKISCFFRIQSKYFGMSTKYDFVMKQNQKVVLSAKKQHFSLTQSKYIISSNQKFITKRNSNPDFIGRLESNFSGTVYDLYEIENFEKGSSKFSDYDPIQKHISQIRFEKNLWGYEGIRKMNVFKANTSKLTKNDVAKNIDLSDILERREISKLIQVKTRKPTFDRTKKKYTLDFAGKAKVPSGKNVILEEAIHEEADQVKIKQNRPVTVNPCLLIGKQRQNQYLVQISYPLSMYEAFGICLANNDSKLFVN